MTGAAVTLTGHGRSTSGSTGSGRSSPAPGWASDGGSRAGSAAAGCDVVLADKDAATLADAVAEVEARRGPRGRGDRRPARPRRRCAAFVAAGRRELGGLDVAVNNVGSLAGRMPASFVDLDDDALRDVVEQNLFVTMWSCHAEARRDGRGRRRAGVIVNVTLGGDDAAVAAHGALRRGQGRRSTTSPRRWRSSSRRTASACSRSRRAPRSPRWSRPRSPTSRSPALVDGAPARAAGRTRRPRSAGRGARVRPRAAASPARSSSATTVPSWPATAPGSDRRAAGLGASSSLGCPA